MTTKITVHNDGTKEAYAKVKAATRALGTSFNSIESELLRRRIRGTTLCNRNCALAKYFIRSLNIDINVSIYSGYTTIYPHGMLIGLTPKLERFIERYDSYKCNPRLYAKPERWTPPIAGYQYAIERTVCNETGLPILSVTDECPYKITTAIYNNCLEGWQVNGHGLFIYLSNAILWYETYIKNKNTSFINSSL